jgi:release factor glutamine methyltransferase
VGTGSGAIAVSLAAHRPGLQVYATDVSAGALQVARDNARNLLGPEHTRIAFIGGPLLDGIAAPLHLVAANLPYVPSAAIAGLAPAVRVYEPHLALDGGADGLDYYRALLPQAAGRLVPGGALLMECDPRQSAALQGLARATFRRAAVVVLQDLAGLDRVVEVRVPAPVGDGPKRRAESDAG